MSTAKSLLIDRINNISDDMDEMQILERLYMLSRFEHSLRRCETEGTVADSELDAIFAKKREALVNA